MIKKLSKKLKLEIVDFFKFISSNRSIACKFDCSEATIRKENSLGVSRNLGGIPKKFSNKESRQLVRFFVNHENETLTQGVGFVMENFEKNIFRSIVKKVKYNGLRSYEKIKSQIFLKNSCFMKNIKIKTIRTFRKLFFR